MKNNNKTRSVYIDLSLTGCILPMSSLRMVDLPTPLGPTMAMRESMSTPKSTFSNSTSLPYENETPQHIFSFPTGDDKYIVIVMRTRRLNGNSYQIVNWPMCFFAMYLMLGYFWRIIWNLEKLKRKSRTLWHQHMFRHKLISTATSLPTMSKRVFLVPHGSTLLSHWYQVPSYSYRVVRGRAGAACPARGSRTSPGTPWSSGSARAAARRLKGERSKIKSEIKYQITDQRSRIGQVIHNCTYHAHFRIIWPVVKPSEAIF